MGAGPDVLARPDYFGFRPDAARAALVAARVRSGLADSLAAALRSLAPRVPPADDLIARIRAGPVAPVVFGAYTELVEAIFADDLETAAAVAGTLACPGFGAIDGLRIVTLVDSDLGPGQSARYRRLLDSDPEIGTGLLPLAPAEVSEAAARVREGLALLDDGGPELAGEFRTLIHEVVLVESANGAFFDGGTSFQLWGALFLRLAPDATRVDIAESLAHEAAHALLFGFSLGMPLVENPDDERYTSPLRPDLRPLDGIFHATYVIARMYYALGQLIASGRLSPAETEAAEAGRRRHARQYKDGARLLEKHARWTPAGEAAFRSAEAWMAEATA